MKKFVKFFPVALAAFALASCSDDMATSSVNNVDENALYLSIENTDDATRVGVVGNATDAYTSLKFRWTKGDIVRVYDDNLAKWDKYEFTGDDFAEDATGKFSWVDPNDGLGQLANYCVALYPADAVDAVYLDKDSRTLKHIEMTLPPTYDFLKQAANAETGVKEGYRCDIPMYGAVATGSMNVETALGAQMNFLTAWTNIYLRNLPADVRYIAVVSKTQPLYGPFKAEVHVPLADGDEPWLLANDAHKADEFGNILWSEINKDMIAQDQTGINFPLPVQKYDDIRVYALKFIPGVQEQDPEAIGADLTDWETLETAGLAIEIGKRAPLNITRRKQCWQVKYTYTYYLDTDAFDPFRPGEITKVLEAQKNNIVGDFSIVPYSKADGLSPVDPAKAKCLTSGAGDNYTHRIEIPNIAEEQKANIILDFTGAGIKYDEALQIYDMNPETNQFAGKLTIKTGKIQGGSSDKAKIEINLPKAEVWIVGDGATSIGNVDVQNAKVVHIGDGQTMTFQDDTRKTWFKGGKLYIEDNTDVKFVYAQAYSGYIDPESGILGHAEELILNPGGRIANTAFIETNCNVTVNGAGYDGVANKEYTGTYNGGLATIVNLDCSKVTTDILVQSQGFSRIGGLVAPTTKNKLNHLKFTTKLFQKSASDKTPVAGAILTDYSGKKAIFTGAQLAQAAKDGVATETCLMADVVDMNGVEWTGGELKANFSGWNHNTATNTWKDTSKDAEKFVATKTGKNIITGMTIKAVSQNGLFKNINAAATVAGLEFTSPKFENTGATVVNYTGVVAGVIDATDANFNFTNVKVTGLSVNSKAGNFIGGLVGAVVESQASVEFVNVDVAATSIAARSFVGGLVGGFKAKVTEVRAFDSKAALAGLSLSLADGVTTLQPLRAGTWAAFFGGTEDNPAIVVKLYDCTYGTAIAASEKGAGINNQGLRFGANADANDVPFFGGNPWIGFCGLVPSSGVPSSNLSLTTYKSVSDAKKKKDFFVYAYDDQGMLVKRWTGDGNYATTTQVCLDGSAKTGASKDKPLSVSYLGAAQTSHANAAWESEWIYGTTVYLPYPNKALAYGNVYEPTTFAATDK